MHVHAVCIDDFQSFPAFEFTSTLKPLSFNQPFNQIPSSLSSISNVCGSSTSFPAHFLRDFPKNFSPLFLHMIDYCIFLLPLLGNAPSLIARIVRKRSNVFVWPNILSCLVPVLPQLSFFTVLRRI